MFGTKHTDPPNPQSVFATQTFQSRHIIQNFHLVPKTDSQRTRLTRLPTKMSSSKVFLNANGERVAPPKKETITFLTSMPVYVEVDYEQFESWVNDSRTASERFSDAVLRKTWDEYVKRQEESGDIEVECGEGYDVHGHDEGFAKDNFLDAVIGEIVDTCEEAREGDLEKEKEKQTDAARKRLEEVLGDCEGKDGLIEALMNWRDGNN